MITRFKNLGLFLKNSRDIANLTQRQVSDSLGYANSQFISNIERGLCAPPLKIVRKLMQLYKIPLTKMVDVLVAEQKKFIQQQLKTDSIKIRRARAG